MGAATAGAEDNYCKNILSGQSSHTFEFSVFQGVEIGPDSAAKYTGYPATWRYFLVGGESLSEQAGINLRGTTARTFIAVKPDGSKITLKQYSLYSGLSEDLGMYNLLYEELSPFSYFKVPKVAVSPVNPMILEIEHFEGEGLIEQHEKNQHHPDWPRVIEQYNEALAHLRAQFNGKDFAPQDSYSSEGYGYFRRDFYYYNGKISLAHDNILVIEDASTPTGLAFVIIDPD